MQIPEDNKDGARVTQAILSILLKSFPTRTDVSDWEVAELVGITWETATDDDGESTTTYDDLPSGANFADMTDGILAWLSLEGLTHHGDENWSSVILTAKGLKALNRYPSYMPAI